MELKSEFCDYHSSSSQHTTVLHTVNRSELSALATKTTCDTQVIFPFGSEIWTLMFSK